MSACMSSTSQSPSTTPLWQAMVRPSRSTFSPDSFRIRSYGQDSTQLAPTQARLAIYSEAPEQPPLTGWLKRLRGRILAWRWPRRFAFVLAVGGVGCDFFRRISFPPSAIEPFGYSLAPPSSRTPAVRPQGEAFRFVAAGQLVPAQRH